MVTILDTFLEHYTQLKLVGKRYTDADRDSSGTFGEKWGLWHRNGWFSQLEKSGTSPDGSYVGAMRITEQGFEYWIGMLLTQEETPQGFDAVNIPAENLAVCYLYGKDGSADIFGMEAHEACVSAWEEKGWLPSGWYFERYNCPRYTSPDKKGNVILDYCACVTPGNKEN